jgi:hypothetical protein
VFESRETLAREIAGLLDAIRQDAGGRYACIVEAKGVAFESPEPEGREVFALRRILEDNVVALFAIPAALASGAPMDDVFVGWEHDELFLAFINGRVAVVVACGDAEALKQRAMKALRALSDRLFRWNETYRMDAKGSGFFFGSPKLDLVVIGKSQAGD